MYKCKTLLVFEYEMYENRPLCYRALCTIFVFYYYCIDIIIFFQCINNLFVSDTVDVLFFTLFARVFCACLFYVG